MYTNEEISHVRIANFCLNVAHAIQLYLIVLGGLDRLVALARLPCGHTYYKVFGSGLSRYSPVAMATAVRSGSCQSPPPVLHAAVALHELHVRAELLLAAVRITPILGRHVGRQARRCLSNLGLTELHHLLCNEGTYVLILELCKGTST